MCHTRKAMCMRGSGHGDPVMRGMAREEETELLLQSKPTAAWKPQRLWPGDSLHSLRTVSAAQSGIPTPEASGPKQSHTRQTA